MTLPTTSTLSGAAGPEGSNISMEMDAASAHIDKPAPQAESSAEAHVACPCCQRKMIRIWRRPSDRLLSIFTPLHRYRCDSHDCRWEGNIGKPRLRRDSAARESGSQSDTPEGRAPTAFAVHVALVLIGAVTVFAAAYSDWWSTGDSLVSDLPWNAYERIGKPEAGAAATNASDSSLYRSAGR